MEWRTQLTSHQGEVLHILETHTLHQALDLIKSITDGDDGVWRIEITLMEVEDDQDK